MEKDDVLLTRAQNKTQLEQTVSLDLNHYRKLMYSKGITGSECEVIVHKIVMIAEIKHIIEQNGWTQAQAAERIGVKQPRIAELNRICVDKFSTDLLIKYLYRLNRVVEVSLLDRKRSTTAPVVTVSTEAAS